MILTPAPLQRPALAGTLVYPMPRSGAPAPARAVPAPRPVLQSSMRVPQQLCLDLQPRQR